MTEDGKIKSVREKMNMDDCSLFLITQELNDIKSNYQNELSEIILHMAQT